MPISRPKVGVSIDQRARTGALIHHSVHHCQKGDLRVSPMRDGVDEGRPPDGGAAGLTSATSSF